MSSQQPSDRIDGPREAVGRMANEPMLDSRNPRERKRNRVSLAHLSGGMVAGAAVFAGLLAIIAQLVGQHYAAWTYVIIGVVGAGVGSGIAPLIALARQDGADNDIVNDRRPGRADAPIEGAEAIDEGRRCARAATARNDAPCCGRFESRLGEAVSACTGRDVRHRSS